MIPNYPTKIKLALTRSGLYSLVFHFFGAGYLEIGLKAAYWRI